MGSPANNAGMVKQISQASSEKPSINDRKRAAQLWQAIFFIAATAVIVFCLSVHSEAEADLFWQIRCGSEIIATGSAPHRDTYSWTRYGAPWNVNEWLSFVLYAWSYRAGSGFTGPFVLMEIVLLTLCIGFYTLCFIESENPLIAFVLTLVSLPALSSFFQLRPYLFSFLFIAVTAFILLRVIAGNACKFWLASLPIMFALWANLHQGVVAGVSMVGLTAVSTAIEALFSRASSRHGSSRLDFSLTAFLFATTAACFLATLLTPYNFGLYRLIWVTLADINALSSINEWQPLRIANNVSSYCIILLFISFLVTTVVQWKNMELRIGRLLVLATTTQQSLVHVRNLPFAIIACTLFFCAPLSQLFEECWTALRSYAAGKQPEARPLPTFVLVPILTIAFGILTAITLEPVANFRLIVRQSPSSLANYAFGLQKFPLDATTFMDFCDFPAGMKLYNDYNIGGLLIFCRPTDRVFIDGRDDIYAGPFLDRDVALADRAKNGQPPSLADKQFLDEHDYDCAIVQNPLAAYYFARRPDYALVYVHRIAPMFDTSTPNCWIFVHKRPQFASLIERTIRIWANHNDGQVPLTGL